MEKPSGDKGRLGGKFEGFSHTPKDDMWARISAGQGAAHTPGRFAGLFAGYTHLPHARVWRRIARTLQPRRGSVILLRWSIAASLIAFLGWGTYQAEFAPKVKPLPASTFAERQVRLPNEPVVGCGRSSTYGFGLGLDLNAAGNILIGKPAATKRPASILVSAPAVAPALQDPGLNTPSITLVENNAPHNVAHHTTAPADSQALAQQQAARRDTFITEIFPEIELPQGDEAENAFTLSLGSSMLSAQGGAFKTRGIFERDQLAQDALYSGTGGFVPQSNGFSKEAKESFQTPLSFGFFADLPLSRRWALGLGTSYTLMRSDLIDRSKATRQYLGLGTRATFMILKAGRAASTRSAASRWTLGSGRASKPPSTTRSTRPATLRPAITCLPSSAWEPTLCSARTLHCMAKWPPAATSSRPTRTSGASARFGRSPRWACG